MLHSQTINIQISNSAILNTFIFTSIQSKIEKVPRDIRRYIKNVIHLKKKKLQIYKVAIAESSAHAQVLGPKIFLSESNQVIFDKMSR